MGEIKEKEKEILIKCNHLLKEISPESILSYAVILIMTVLASLEASGMPAKALENLKFHLLLELNQRLA